MRKLVLAQILFLCLLPTVAEAAKHWAKSNQGMVATVHPLATDAGVAALRKGGNALDAAIAAALTLGVVDGHNSGLGGGCFVLIHRPDGKVIAIDGREMAPRRSTRDMFLKNGKPTPQASQVGALASGVPGSVLAYEYSLARFGRLKLADLLIPAAKIAERGFKIDRNFAQRLARHSQVLARFSASRAQFLDSSGKAWKAGHRLKLPDLARTYREIARHGSKWFYLGEFAERTANWMKDHGGIIDKKDFASYLIKVRKPIRSTYRGYEILGFPPPSSGGIHVAQILNILEAFDLAKINRESPTRFHHVVTEALKRAFADRAHWLGDADFAKVPRGLINKNYARRLSRQIDLKRATVVARYGTPPRAKENVFGRHTTHIAAADKFGNWVAITATVNTSFGSKVVIPGTGVVMNNQMDDFSINPGVPNAFGLIGGEANAIAPGKRPLSSMSPTIVLKNGNPVLTVGAAGGPRIITIAATTFVRVVDLKLSLADAIAAPRFHHQWVPDTLFCSRDFPDAVFNGLRKMGHKVKCRKYNGIAQAIGVDAKGRFIGIHDPRVPGKAAGPR